ncbi:hypothetical protein ASC84_19625 [Acinetobacter sp. Root1280]|uniref:hypothetical protein n=1 Tax=Acinetobacter sp. Root1280 TaxID=1736444 RepID=UPI0006F9224E|nr:hypothetical protein [Acinetobacter sp. Root1280]KQW99891.1 hypothetical protein ASC84_19625 [Acinetobacter sp. Root1280]
MVNIFVIKVYCETENIIKVIAVDDHWETSLIEDEYYLIFKRYNDPQSLMFKESNDKFVNNPSLIGFNSNSELFLLAVGDLKTAYGSRFYKKHQQVDVKLKDSKRIYLHEERASGKTAVLRSTENTIAETKRIKSKNNDSIIFSILKRALKSRFFYISVLCFIFWQESRIDEINFQVINFSDNISAEVNYAKQVLSQTPVGVDYICEDGTYSYSRNQGHCSWHGGSEININTLKVVAETDIDKRIDTYTKNKNNKHLIFSIFLFIFMIFICPCFDSKFKKLIA